MIRERKYQLLATFVLLSGLLSAQDRSYNPQRILQTIQKLYPTARDIEWTGNELGTVVVSFVKDSISYDAFFTPDGKWIRTEHIIDYSELPRQVQEAFEISEFYDFERGFVYLLEMPRKKTLYKIYVYDPMWIEIELLYDPKGKLAVIE